MKLSLCLMIAIFCVLALEFGESEAWWWRRRKTQRCHGGQPYYFGSTRLFCMTKKGKRGAPSRSTLALKHRWIYYQGRYYEWGINGSNYSVAYRPVDSNRCKSKREKKPAGYSQLSPNCLFKCARSYRRKYGKYRLLWNNCHHFANRMSAILCNYKACPWWCK